MNPWAWFWIGVSAVATALFWLVMNRCCWRMTDDEERASRNCGVTAIHRRHECGC